ncbi:neuronal acetylcholine receptor subunit alpha-7-like [Folsomia candida]|nr:neuronal acetylcholine receptor subunit alpha-7-like [Folsomia candida]
MVGIGINIYQIVEVNEKHQYMTSVLHLWRNWTDENLTWNVSQFDNITYVRIPSTRIWQPDVFLYNMGNEEMLQSANNREILNVIVNHTGTVLSVPPKMLKSICRMDVTWFPWDEQKCDLIFGSWTYSGSEMDFTVREEENMMRYYIPNGEWHLVGIKAKKVDKFYECCSDSYPSVVFTLHIKRNSMYYLYNLIVPCALIGFLAILGFTLPPDSTEKLSLGVTVLFSLIVFLNQITSTMPANSDNVPLIGTYFNCVMFTIALSVVSTIIVNLNIRSGKEPRAIGRHTEKLLLIWLPWILRLDLHKYYDNGGRNKSFRRTMSAIEDAVLMKGEKPKSYQGNEVKVTSSPFFKTVPNLELLKDKWLFAAVVVDRLCLLVSVLFAVISVGIMLVSKLT